MDEWKCVISALYPLRERAIDNRWRKSWEKVSPSCTGMSGFFSFNLVENRFIQQISDRGVRFEKSRKRHFLLK